MTEVEFSLVEPASLCRAAGEDSNLLCLSSAAETELQIMEAILVLDETGCFGGSCWSYLELHAGYYQYLAIENIYYLALMWYHKTT